MAHVRTLRAVRYDPGAVDLGRCLAPPYDVISDSAREELCARDAHNIVRVDDGPGCADDVPGERDRYTRAAALLDAWQAERVLRRDGEAAIYVVGHDFPSAQGAGRCRRLGVLSRVRALPWAQADVIPHERTMRGPKEDRLRLMRATRMQTSAVFCLWDRAPGLAGLLDDVAGEDAAVTCTVPGELGAEELALWVVDDPATVGAVIEALAVARLYIADGHHRFETAAAYAAERGAVGAAADGADAAWALVHLCAADDDAVEVLPTHRLVRPGEGVPDSLAELVARVGADFAATPQPDLAAAVAAARRRRQAEHAIAAAGRDGCALLSAPRRSEPSPRARLDVSVLEERILMRACGLTPERLTAGALGFARDVPEAAAAVASGEACLALCVNGCTTGEILEVSDAGEQMPQKSTYFYPKVPTGLVLSPL